MAWYLRRTRFSRNPNSCILVWNYFNQDNGCDVRSFKAPWLVWWLVWCGRQSYARFSKVHVLFFFQTLGLWILGCRHVLRQMMNLLWVEPCFDLFGYGIWDPQLDILRIEIMRTDRRIGLRSFHSPLRCIDPFTAIQVPMTYNRIEIMRWTNNHFNILHFKHHLKQITALEMGIGTPIMFSHFWNVGSWNAW